MPKLELSVATGDYDRVRPLLDGTVAIDGVAPVFMTLDPEEIVPWATEQGIKDTSLAALCTNDKVRDLIQDAVDDVNKKFAQVEQVKKFTILDHDLSQETGELTPTLKVKRNVVNEKYADRFEKLYSG